MKRRERNRNNKQKDKKQKRKEQNNNIQSDSSLITPSLPNSLANYLPLQKGCSISLKVYPIMKL